MLSLSPLAEGIYHVPGAVLCSVFNSALIGCAFVPRMTASDAIEIMIEDGVVVEGTGNRGVVKKQRPAIAPRILEHGWLDRQMATRERNSPRKVSILCRVYAPSILTPFNGQQCLLPQPLHHEC